MSHCFFCAKPSKTDYHPRCAQTLFGDKGVPELNIRLEDIKEIAKKNLLNRLSITGVQSKISLELESTEAKKQRLTIVGFHGDYILKPPSTDYKNLPENEHLTMLIAKNFSFEVAIASLIRLKSGELCYLTKRFDRKGGLKLQQEDFCQLTERLTEDKYKGSYESIARWIKKNASAPGIDLVRYFELLLFSFVTGNSDMHLKNFSIQTDLNGRVKLAPAYDLLSVSIIYPEDHEELALTLNGKKNKIAIRDWEEFANTIGLPKNVFQKTVQTFLEKTPKILKGIETYPFSNSFQKDYLRLIQSRVKRLG